MTTTTEKLTAPFTYFGGKRRAVDLVWPRFGAVKNYVEPFCGSLAMLLGAPEARRVETVNDAEGFVINFWRAIKCAPESVAMWADWPVSEIDLEARHGWLVNRAERLRWALQDPDYFDAKIAGWWVWGTCAWIGGGWCLGKGPWGSDGATISRRAGDAPAVGKGLHRKLPHVCDGKGINRQLPKIGTGGNGINRQLPADENAGRGEFIRDWFNRLSVRLREVRITCGDWSRVMSPAVTTQHGLTAVFLDPPYDAPGVSKGLYREEAGVSAAVSAWCRANGDDPLLRIAVCGYAGEHNLPGWTVIAGKATSGGYGNRSGNQNHKRETIWLSPNCLDKHSN